MVLVHANMARFDFSPCKKKLFLVPVKYFGFEISLFRDYFQKQNILEDLFKNQKILQGLFFS